METCADIGTHRTWGSGKGNISREFSGIGGVHGDKSEEHKVTGSGHGGNMEGE